MQCFCSELLPEVAYLERWLNLALDHMFLSVIASWNILEFAHFNHTERTTETKKRSYIKTVKSKTRDTEFIILHIFSACPSLPWFFFIPVQHLLSLSSNCLSLSLWQFVSFPQHSLCTAGLVVTIEIAKGFRVTLVEVCTETFVFFFFLFFFLYVNRHTQISRG